MFDIHELLDDLARERPLFHSEADFQFALAWQIKEKEKLDVRLEFPPFAAERVYLDIWLPRAGIAIELKYPTSGLTVNYGDEMFALRNHGTPDLGQYDFLKDISRLERVSARLSQAREGIAILLTNDQLYWDSSRRSDKADDVEFRLNDGRLLPRKMDWPDDKRTNKGKGRQSQIVLNGSYKCAWRDYGHPVNGAAGNKNAQFRYLALPVSQ